MTLTTVAMLRPHLTAENHETLLEAARHKSKRDVEYQIACLAPKRGRQDPDSPRAGSGRRQRASVTGTDALSLRAGV